MGNILVVSVTQNAWVNKGPGRPVFDELERAAIVKEMRCVDRVVLVTGAMDALESVKPDIFVKGQDYAGKIEAQHADYCKAHGIQIRFTNEPMYSATKIINDRLGKS